MGRTFEYPKKSFNTVKRYDGRGTYDLGAIHTIINTTSVLHVSFPSNTEEPFPAVLPMIGQMGSFDYPSASIDEPMDCYIHGYISARISRLAKDSEKGLPVTIAATKVDGYVLALTPFSHSYNYRSAVLQGYAKPVVDEDEKTYALKLITDSVVPGRWDHSRTPPDKAEIQSTMILKVTIEGGSGKIRTGGPHDDAKDEKRDDVTSTVWIGVLPIHEAFGPPVPAPGNKVNQIPDYITSYMTRTTEQNQQDSRRATEET